MEIKVAANDNLRNAEGEVRQHQVMQGLLALPKPHEVPKPGLPASEELLGQLGQLYKQKGPRTGASTDAKRYAYMPPEMKKIPSNMVPVKPKPHRTFVLSSRTEKTCMWAYGEIHMIYELFDVEQMGRAVLTFVHEATHKFASTSDEGPDKGYFRFTEPSFKPQIPAADTPNNADSYAWLLYQKNKGYDVVWPRS